jgi:hypothetical protein
MLDENLSFDISDHEVGFSFRSANSWEFFGLPDDLNPVVHKIKNLDMAVDVLRSMGVREIIVLIG